MTKRMMDGLAMCMGLLLAAAPYTAHAGEHPFWGEVELQKLYQTHLRKEGLQNSIDSDGDVRFERNGRIYFIEVSEKDVQFFRVVLPNIWRIESIEERRKVLEAVNGVNNSMKVAKTYTTGDNVWVAVEMFVASPDQFTAVFGRSLDVVDQAVKQFAERMR